MVGDGEIGGKYFEPIIVELLSIIGDYYLWDLKSTYDILPNKITGILLSGFGKSFCHDPLGEIIYGDQQKFLLQWSSR